MFILQEQICSRRHRNTPFDNKKVSSYIKHTLLQLLLVVLFRSSVRGCEVCQLAHNTPESSCLVFTLAGPVQFFGDSLAEISLRSHQNIGVMVNSCWDLGKILANILHEGPLSCVLTVSVHLKVPMK